MQSGISASEELQSAFRTLLTTPSQRGLLATIASERIVPLTTIPSTSASFSSDLANLAPHLKPNEALYILLKRADDLSSSTSTRTNNTTITDDPSSKTEVGTLVAITYIPSPAPVRSKMLFASTRLTLVRDLGSEHFRETLFVTAADELSAEGWARHEAHAESAAPLTEEERSLKEIREAEAVEGTGAGMEGRKRGLVSVGRVGMRVGEGVVEALKALGLGGGNLVQLRMDVQTETLELVDSSSSSSSVSAPKDIADCIAATEPRYVFYRFDDAPGGGGSAADNVVFISTCPSVSKIKERMLFAASRRSVVAMAQQEAGLKVERRIEVTNPDEVTEAVVLDEFKIKGVEEAKEGNKGFARPKRPGRR
ncbi:actin depolymerizing protein [Westerdykella ornata]|uniref:Actin depolymerizing protein n=1 Tax=Westerdykella ornata TaxID=318751 RepID=A0A6A6JQG6_WESOR|nr:actin depolymerizing protein [Westerdykella ornata]KAF2277926.1 actin depolymerizing protein [Westerdykella ornata]